ncbi:MAG: alanine/ornithine racemase family PLP-dependent enzyme [Candidatus Delongbacteria bacterium]|nr:alanine/ornithine racemase family PLP-dependent enzyme [Candidatus Delongbacteria bacterium]
MAYITLNRKKLEHNFRFLDRIFKKNNIKWSVVTKLLCGNKLYIGELLKLNVFQAADSRISNLRTIKSIKPDIETIYIKPPAKHAVSNVVKYADISLNTSISVIKMLSKEAVKQDKTHKIIIMIEMGELREGIMRDDLIDFYSSVFELPNIEVTGIGTNLACLYGVLPNNDKLIQLSLYKQLIEATFNKKIPLVSGGASVTIPLIFNHSLPKGINHFRVGETLFLGTDVYHDSTYEKMHNDVFRLFAEIIELIEKPIVPMGEMGTNVQGESAEVNEEDYGKTTKRALIDLGLLDIEENQILPLDPDISIVGASSDMIVMDLGDNEKNYKVGDFLEFRMTYLGTVRIMNSKYIEKRLAENN